MESLKSYVKTYEFPEVLKTALKETRTFVTKFEGLMTLFAWNEAEMETLLVDPSQPGDRMQPVLSFDPNRGIPGYYCIPAYVLKAESMYGMGDNLVWIPGVNKFGNYAPPLAARVGIYPATWEEIEAELSDYVVGDKGDEDISAHVNLWEHFTFLPEHLADEARATLYSEPDEENLKRAALIIAQYERALLECPVNFELQRHYVYLQSLYNYRLRFYLDTWDAEEDLKSEITDMCDKISYISYHVKQIADMIM
jgi:hypothetical protein